MSVSAQERNFGALIPDPKSDMGMTIETDFHLPKGYKLPSTMDLSAYFPPAGNQHRQYSCAGWALGYGLMSYRNNLADARTYPRTGDPDLTQTFSPAYLFNLMKSFDRSACDTGVDFEQLADVVTISGCCTWQELPYDTALMACRELGATTMLRAIPNHTPAMVSLDQANKEQWMYHLSKGLPIITLIVIDTAFIDGGYATRGDDDFIWSWDPYHVNVGGHAVVCTGYVNDSVFTFINSFGQQWGDKGHFKAEWEMLGNQCYGAYVMPNDTTSTFPPHPGRPVDAKDRNGDVVNEAFELGGHQLINDRKYKLTGLSADQERAVVQVFHPKSDSLLQTLHMRADQPYTFYEENERIELRFTRRSSVGRKLQRNVPFTLREGPSASDAFLNEREAMLRRLKESIR